ncbi:cupin domain-containing protein [Streptomyces sp. ISL-12]|uniref:cupin domain-containing protein n=1 Tax=Streptomyces sp. ISL-12 TaxID=2819177 RepID=UPI0027E0276A|nr:cupin domain-containing protein [Streptomyces sp. ISL-12]
MIVADTSDASRVFGVHGTEGLTYWKCLARRTGTAGSWEAVEWASLPPGAVSGVHLHTRTEEIYFVLAGTGELSLDGTARPVGPGSIALTRAGSTHGLRNTGAEDLDWLVVEMSTPATHAVLTGTPASRERREGMRSKVYDLARAGEIDPSEVFDGPLSLVRTLQLDAGEERKLLADGAEHVVFVLAGSGAAESPAGHASLTPGTSVTLPLGGRLTLRADQEGLRVFHAVLEVR